MNLAGNFFATESGGSFCDLGHNGEHPSQIRARHGPERPVSPGDATHLDGDSPHSATPFGEFSADACHVRAESVVAVLVLNS